MKKYQYVKCSKCGKVDAPSKANVGTATVMQCEDCGTPYAQLCRECCSTGHGTKFIDSWDDEKVVE